MTRKRTVHVIATAPEAAQALVHDEHWGTDSTVVWVGEPRPMVVLGLPAGVNLYEVSVIFRTH